MNKALLYLYSRLVETPTLKDALQAIEHAQNMQDEELTDFITWLGTNATYNAEKDYWILTYKNGVEKKYTSLGIHYIYNLQNEK
jgi:hypothetical protein